MWFKKTRADRNPLSSSKQIHSLLNKLFYEKFKWYPRTEGLFVTNGYSYASDFGRYIHIILPKNGFKYITEPEEMYNNIYSGNIYNNKIYHDEDLIQVEKFYRKRIENYKDNNLPEVISNYYNEIEIVLKCSEYLYIVDDYSDGYNKEILMDFLDTL